MNLIKCSVCILTFNSGKTLEKTLQNLKNFGEVVVCDGGSTDQTLLLAKEFGCTIITQDKRFKNKEGKIIDFSGVRNQCIEVAKYNWIFMLDSDEYLSSELLREISVVANTGGGNESTIYGVSPRYVFVGGISVEKSAALPSYQLRLFNKLNGLQYRKKVHEKLDFDKTKYTINNLNGRRVTYWNQDDFKNYKKKQDYYLEIEKSRFKKKSLTKLLKQLLIYTLQMVKRIVKIIYFLTTQPNKERMPLRIELLSIRYIFKLVFFELSYNLKNRMAED